MSLYDECILVGGYVVDGMTTDQRNRWHAFIVKREEFAAYHIAEAKLKAAIAGGMVNEVEDLVRHLDLTGRALYTIARAWWTEETEPKAEEKPADPEATT